MLNYLGSSLGGPGTMPSAVPGAAQSAPDFAGAIRKSMPVPPGLAAAVAPGLMPPSAPVPPGMEEPDPASTQYETVTQSDGSILLHIKNPDGTLGPVVKIVNPPKPRQQ